MNKILITIIFLIIAVYAYQNYIINLSLSEPLGIYKIIRKNKEISRGDLVAVCLSKDWQDYGLQRNYLLPSIRCHGSAPLIKTVIAVPNDNVTLNENNIIVNNKIYSYKTLKFDSKGKPLKIFPRGIYRNSAGYWLIGTNSSKSWDSRYWGSVNESQVIFEVNSIFIVSNKYDGLYATLFLRECLDYFRL